jgi:hypothetical protein
MKPQSPNDPTSTTMEAWMCLRCKYKWPKRDNIPVRCANPECASPYWNIPRTRKKRKLKTDLEGEQ